MWWKCRKKNLRITCKNILWREYVFENKFGKNKVLKNETQTWLNTHLNCLIETSTQLPNKNLANFLEKILHSDPFNILPLPNFTCKFVPEFQKRLRSKIAWMGWVKILDPLLYNTIKFMNGICFFELNACLRQAENRGKNFDWFTQYFLVSIHLD